MATTNGFPRGCRCGLTALVLVLLMGCGGSGGTGGGGAPGTGAYPLQLNYEAPPFDLEGINAMFARDVAYGPYEETAFDIFLVDSEVPTPLVIYIHGGGFTDGDKRVVHASARNEIRDTLAGGASYATINYRLLDAVDTEGIIKPMTDSRRCLQFLRYYHAQLNVDPSRIALYGASAGAGTCLWLGFSHDMADPDAADPILRESTRVSVLGGKGTQCTYDLLQWVTVVFKSWGMTLDDMTTLPDASEQGMMSFYGLATLDELYTSETKAYRARVDMLGMMSPDDPPLWVRNHMPDPDRAPESLSELFHHSLHAFALQERAAEVGLECQAYMPALFIEDPADEGVIEFLLARL